MASSSAFIASRSAATRLALLLLCIAVLLEHTLANTPLRWCNGKTCTPEKVLTQWTIIGRDYNVVNLGYSVALNGETAALSQQDGAYLSAVSDRRLFSSGADKVFITLPSGTGVGTRVAASQGPGKLGITSIVALGAKNSVYMASLKSDSWCTAQGTADSCPSAQNQFQYQDDSHKYQYKITSTALRSLGRQVATSDAHVLTSGYIPSGFGSGMGAVALYEPNTDFTRWTQLGEIERPTTGSANFGHALAIVASTTRGSPLSADGPCKPGASASFACRFLVGDYGTGQVHVYTHDRSRFVQRQVLEGPTGSRFGHAISSTAHTGRELVLVGAPYAASRDGVVFMYEWSAGSSQYVLGGELTPIFRGSQTIRGAQFGYALDHVVTPNEVRMVVGAPKKSRVLVMHTSTSRPSGSNRTVTVEGDIDGSTRNYPNSPDEVTTMLGASVAIGQAYVYVGVPRFNHDQRYQHSVGAVHVMPYCSRNEYVDLLQGENLGATCRPCPGPATSSGKQTLKCTGCTGIPANLPPEAKISSGCSISCEGSTLSYDKNSNSCVHVSRAVARGVTTVDNSRHSTLLVVISILVILCFLCCCCYLCRSPSQSNTLQHTGVNRGAARPRIEVLLEMYPVTVLEASTVLPNEADSCVICLNDFKPGEEIRTLSCEHVFHKPCIDNWLGTHTTCPLCNVQLQTRPTEAPTEPSDQATTQQADAVSTSVHVTVTSSTEQAAPSQ